MLARASAMIVPSTWDEPFPLVTIEGALARVPLVASDVGGVGEGMRHEEHALLFARGDAAGAAAALARVLREDEQTPRPAGAGVDRAQGMFGLGPYLDEQERFLTDALAALRAGGQRKSASPLVSRSGMASARIRRSATLRQVNRVEWRWASSPRRRAVSGSASRSIAAKSCSVSSGSTTTPPGPIIVAVPPLVVPIEGTPAPPAST